MLSDAEREGEGTAWEREEGEKVELVDDVGIKKLLSRASES